MSCGPLAVSRLLSEVRACAMNRTRWLVTLDVTAGYQSRVGVAA